MLKSRAAISLALLAVCAGAPVAMGQQEFRPTDAERREAARAAAMRQAEAERESASEIRVYDLAAVLGDGDVVPLSSRVASLQGVVDFQFSAITGTVFAIRATPDDHDQLETLLAQVRDIKGGGDLWGEADEDEDEDEEFDGVAYTVRMMLVGAPTGAEVNVGDRIDPRANRGFEILAYPQLSMGSGEGASISMTQVERYIAGYMPVVSGSAVGYQTQTESVESGLIVDIEVEPGPDGTAEVEIEGIYSTAEIVRETLELSGATLPIGLPIRRERLIETEAMVELDAGMIVIASLRGLDGQMPRLLFAVEVIEHELEDD